MQREEEKEVKRVERVEGIGIGEGLIMRMEGILQVKERKVEEIEKVKEKGVMVENQEDGEEDIRMEGEEDDGVGKEEEDEDVGKEEKEIM